MPSRRGQLVDPDPRLAADQGEDLHLPAGEGAALDDPAEVPGEVEEERAEPVGEREVLGGRAPGRAGR